MDLTSDLNGVAKAAAEHQEKMQELKAVTSQVAQQHQIAMDFFQEYRAMRRELSDALNMYNDAVREATKFSDYSTLIKPLLVDAAEHMKVIQDAYASSRQAIMTASEYARALQPLFSSLEASREAVSAFRPASTELFESIYQSLGTLSDTAESFDSLDTEIEVSSEARHQVEGLIDAAVSTASSNSDSDAPRSSVSVQSEPITATGNANRITAGTLWAVIQFVLMVLALVVPVYLSNQQSEQVERQIAVEEQLLDEAKATRELTEDQILLLQSIDDSLKTLVEATQKPEQDVNPVVQPEIHEQKAEDTGKLDNGQN